jgi:hypothetical protein
MFPNVPKKQKRWTPEDPPFGLVAVAFLVALGQFCSNTLLTDVQDDASVTDRLTSFMSPRRQRRRITARLRAEVVASYEEGMSSRQVAEALALGRTTVLSILKVAGVAMRPQGRKY